METCFGDDIEDGIKYKKEKATKCDLSFVYSAQKCDLLFCMMNNAIKCKSLREADKILPGKLIIHRRLKLAVLILP